MEKKKTTSIGNTDNPPSDETKLKPVIKNYSSPSLLKIKYSITNEKLFRNQQNHPVIKY